MAAGLLFITGELSADLYAARLIRYLRSSIPNMTVRGLGGQAMAAAGTRLLYPLAERAVMGVSEGIGSLGRLRIALRCLREAIVAEPPAVAVLLDYAGFNLQAARLIRRYSPKTKILYYIPPKLWAWGSWRLRRLRRDVDLVLSIFPFETEFYRNADIPVEYCGHPLPELLAENPAESGFCKKYMVQQDKPGLLLLPGSRTQEWERLLPIFLKAAAIFQRTHRCDIWLAPPPSIDRVGLTARLADQPLAVRVVDERYAAMRNARVALAASGTVTLELALNCTPTVVAYRMASLTWLLARALVKIPYVALPNILANREIMPELLQGDCCPEKLARAAGELWKDERQQDVREALRQIIAPLCETEGIKCAARVIERTYRAAA